MTPQTTMLNQVWNQIGMWKHKNDFQGDNCYIKRSCESTSVITTQDNANACHSKMLIVMKVTLIVTIEK